MSELKEDKRLIRPSLYDVTQHRNDDIKNQGFKYQGQLFKKTLSPIILEDEKRSNIIQELDFLISFLIDYVKEIKKTYNYTIAAKDKTIN